MPEGWANDEDEEKVKTNFFDLYPIFNLKEGELTLLNVMRSSLKHEQARKGEL